ncbi:MAG: 23S rRNA (adenine(2030)-N(6))-methyltransferase RlmJ [Hyphomonadaceae bacterium]
MNYRHAFHAGNHADVLKHAILLACLDHLKKKPAPFGVLDTHAGGGSYNLESDEAQRSPEWRDGIAKLWDWENAPEPFAALFEAVRRFNPAGALKTYPGSPTLIAEALREGDRLAACELHSEEAADLKRAFARRAGVQIHRRDGWEALDALLPFPERRGLVLIDPPYEAEGELVRAARAVREVHRKAQTATILWWRPLKDERELTRADAEALSGGRAEALRVDLELAPPARDGRLTASSVLIIHPPFMLAAALIAAAPALEARLSPDARIKVLAP